MQQSLSAIGAISSPSAPTTRCSESIDPSLVDAMRDFDDGKMFACDAAPGSEVMNEPRQGHDGPTQEEIWKLSGTHGMTELRIASSTA